MLIKAHSYHHKAAVLSLSNLFNKHLQKNNKLQSICTVSVSEAQKPFLLAE